MEPMKIDGVPVKLGQRILIKQGPQRWYRRLWRAILRVVTFGRCGRVHREQGIYRVTAVGGAGEPADISPFGSIGGQHTSCGPGRPP